MPQVLNNEVDILNVANIDNDIRDSYTRAMIAGEEKETYCTRQGGYDINEFFIWTDRQIYKTKAVIAQGDTFILNTNIVLAGTLSDQMYQLFAQSPESIREVISNIEEGSTATKNYHAGEYFIWNDGFLYKVTAATINIGTAFVVDTNVVKCNNVTDELSSLNEALTNNDNKIWDEINNNGAVNLCPNNAKSQVINGITFTVNSDKTITVSGTASSNAVLYLSGSTNAAESFDLPNGQYKITGCPSGGSQAGFLIYFDDRSADGQSTVGGTADMGNGGVTTITHNKARVYIYIGNGTVITTPITFKPMVSLASLDLSYNDYVPYAMTNRELTDLKAPMFSPSLARHANTIKINSGDSYTVPTDGIYVLSCGGTSDTASSEFTIGSLPVLGVIGNGKTVIATIPLKKGTVLNTRANYGIYLVMGYFD